MKIKINNTITTYCNAFFDPANEEVEIRQGSILHINPDVRGGIPRGNFASINEYIDSGIVGRNADGTLIVNNSIFESPSAAWVMVSGKCGSGWEKWIIDEGPLSGRPLNDIRQSKTISERQVSFLPISKKELDRVIYKSDETDLYFKLSDFFKKHRRFFEFENFQALQTCQDLNSPGVYVVRKRISETIYVGMAGKIKRDSQQNLANGGTIYTRITQSSLPYAFEIQDNQSVLFRFSPNYSRAELKKHPIEERYAESFRMSELLIHCFVLKDELDEISATLLEAIILQNHFKLHGDLPVANNQL